MCLPEVDNKVAKELERLDHGDAIAEAERCVRTHQQPHQQQQQSSSPDDSSQ